MKQQLIFWPLVVQCLLILWLFVRLGIVKARAREAGEIDPSLTSIDNDAWPIYVRKVSNNIRNQFQLPVLFSVVLLAFFGLEAVDMVVLVLAAVFVLSRLIHTYIHIGRNHVPTRTRVFTIGYFSLVGLVIWLGRALLVS